MISGERRRERRIPTDLPVLFGIGEGRTHDLSASGMFFYTQQALSPTDALSFDLLFNEDAAAHSPLRASCAGRIVRVIPMGAQYGVAIKFESFEV